MTLLQVVTGLLTLVFALSAILGLVYCAQDVTNKVSATGRVPGIARRGGGLGRRVEPQALDVAETAKSLAALSDAIKGHSLGIQLLVISALFAAIATAAAIAGAML